MRNGFSDKMVQQAREELKINKVRKISSFAASVDYNMHVVWEVMQMCLSEPIRCDNILIVYYSFTKHCHVISHGLPGYIARLAWQTG